MTEPIDQYDLDSLQVDLDTAQDMVKGSTGFAVYRFYDEAGHLLYIGASTRVGSRIRSHFKEKPWAKDITHITLKYHESEDVMFEAERTAIMTERPAHNVVHNSGPRPAQAQAPPTLPTAPAPADDEDDDWIPPTQREWERMRAALKNERRERMKARREHEEKLANAEARGLSRVVELKQVAGDRERIEREFEEQVQAEVQKRLQAQTSNFSFSMWEELEETRAALKRERVTRRLLQNAHKNQALARAELSGPEILRAAALVLENAEDGGRP